jgi:LSD1 subclass zinc finger protein
MRLFLVPYRCPKGGICRFRRKVTYVRGAKMVTIRCTKCGTTKAGIRSTEK